MRALGWAVAMAVTACSGKATVVAATADTGPGASDGGASASSQQPDGGTATQLDGGAATQPDGGQTTISGQPDAGSPSARGGGDWMQYRHDARGVSMNQGDFSVADAQSLVPRWTIELGQYVYTQAMIADDLVVFTTAFSGKVVAVDAQTGATRWTRTLNSQISTTCGGSTQPGFWAAPALDSAAVYVASPDGHAYALSRADGSTLWATKVADPSAAGHGEFIQSSPSLSAAYGKVFLGVASSFHCDEVAGRLVALDLATGALQAAPLVGPGQQGATVWSTVSVAEEEDRLYVATGNRIGDPAAEPNAQAILAVDAHSLAVVDRWQNPTTLQNADFGSSPTLIDQGGLKLVAATSKDGWLYVLRRSSLAAGPLWKFQLATVDPAHPDEGGDPTVGFGSISSPTVANGLLIAAGGRTPEGDPGSVVAFDPATGAVVWKHLTPGFVIAPVAAAGAVAVVESSAPDATKSTLELLDLSTGAAVARFDRPIGTFAAPSVGHGLIVWTDAFGHVTALSMPPASH
ncbi:MAG TPA: PQQ-binding-like beta-propeller repeat protein [Myxococcales bacterium]|jgi:outer membrane protein assembly factor BamB